MTVHFHVGVNGFCGTYPGHDRCACRTSSFYSSRADDRRAHSIVCNAAEVTCEDCLELIRGRVERALLKSEAVL